MLSTFRLSVSLIEFWPGLIYFLIIRVFFLVSGLTLFTHLCYGKLSTIHSTCTLIRAYVDLITGSEKTTKQEGAC